MNIKPRFIELYKTGDLEKKSREAHDLLTCCTLCPRSCGVNRLQGQLGFCRSGFLPTVSSYNAHHGEEPPISGTRGSGTIFFSHCNLSCCYCQNWPISQLGQGQEVSCERLAGMMMELQQRGCHNINFVTPSHMIAQILMALEIAVPQGFNLPLVYNTSGYDSLDSLKLLEGVIDIYLPDIRYTDPGAAERYSGAGDYPAVNQATLKEMWRQVGELQLDDEGIAFRGMLVRHLVLPNGLSQTKEALKFLYCEISPRVHLSLMSQFFPAHKANQTAELGRNISREEYRQAVEWTKEYELENGWHQELDDTGGGPPDRIVKTT
ncbi:MAG: radical SAM protein [Candidatus Edwardsbacteria bacterium]|nr:radical SAM protein [Candidatus Edwardsbacteria bacterium]MBU1576601.1 radical SAM protein [Candidatus Edwardsbacteria bacterium]MBU2464392.1 radical SAM protein [Candidatus Edwardsbacteria bacterium]MBU2594944.1 radical SAM protein [Candidatus Edwardsbacteria bacterium]